MKRGSGAARWVRGMGLPACAACVALVWGAGPAWGQSEAGAAWIGPWTRASAEPVIRPDAAAVFADPVTGQGGALGGAAYVQPGGGGAGGQGLGAVSGGR